MAKIALVTGAGHGIGKGEAIELAKAGYDVCISYCGSEEQAKDTVEKVRALGRRSMAIKADLTRRYRPDVRYARAGVRDH